jgi:hypothetical protein
MVAEPEPEEAQVVAGRFLRFALDEVRKYEGTINQVRRDGFTALFGAPIGHEDHARRAVLAALGIASGAEVRVRIGINSGLVVIGAISDDLQMDCTPVGDTTVFGQDKKDAMWLAKLTERGMLQPSFVPPAEIRRLREFTRLRAACPPNVQFPIRTGRAALSLASCQVDPVTDGADGKGETLEIAAQERRPIPDTGYPIGRW